MSSSESDLATMRRTVEAAGVAGKSSLTDHGYMGLFDAPIECVGFLRDELRRVRALARERQHIIDDLRSGGDDRI